jgi:flagellar motor switch/type III secretory pathway protein FliN
VSDAVLDPEELEAIQSAIRETAPRRGAQAIDLEPTRLALVTNERLAEAGRPVLLGLANRWVRSATKSLRPYLPGTWQLDVVGAEIIDGSSVKDELRGGWVAALRGDDEAELVLATHGPVIDIAAARRCGAAAPVADQARTPSQVALRLFQPAGKALLDSMLVAWREVATSNLSPSNDLAIISRLIAAPTVLRVVLAFAGSVSGRIQLYVRPDVLAPRPAALAAIKANALRVANALSNVPVEVIVELGTLRMPLEQLRKLGPSTTLTLQGFVDSLVPVYCGGVLKAWARPVVCRGMLAAQIVSIVHDQGTKS